MTQINAYDDYGIPQGKSATGALIAGGTATAMFGGFGYTGQAWLPEVGLYHYKNRTYSPTMGRFMQADPIGYGDGVNLYAYVGGDPINFTDPLGLAAHKVDKDGIKLIDPFNSTSKGPDIRVTAPCSSAVFNRNNGNCDGFDRFNNLTGGRGRVPEGNESGGGGEGGCPPPSGILSIARDVLEGVATGTDVASVGFTAAGITAPVAAATELLGLITEGAILGVNAYDAKVNGNSAPLKAQFAELGTRLIPGGRALQAGLKTVRSATAGAAIRSANGRFASTRLNNQAVPLAGQKLTEKAVGETAEALLMCVKK